MLRCPPGTVHHTLRRGDTLYRLANFYNTTVDDIRNANPGIDPYNLFIGQVLCIPKNSRYRMYRQGPKEISMAELQLRNALRSLWEQHVEWTRMAILSMANDSPDAPYVTARLLRNAPDMAALLRPLYGDANADNFERLIREHLTIASELVKAAKAGDTAAAAKAEKDWYANADDIAYFLSRLNPYWPQEETRSMLYEHLALTKAEALAILNKEYEKSIELYDRVEQQALGMADVLAMGIVRQFPNMFS
ncbi:MAG: LysM peptidoglycan-binding domain-containing protein [Bacillota bacterium]|nr:LysM peptidoglycan-binding domain-containing protein [Bacillota bacterium]